VGFNVPLNTGHIGDEVVHAGMGMKYKSAGAQPATVSHRPQ